MGKSKKKELTFPQKMNKLMHAGVDNNQMIYNRQHDLSSIDSLDERIQRVIGLLNVSKKKSLNMLFFVMYDIESNKVRNQVAKYLLRKGCFRVQRSIFLADLNNQDYEQIRSDLSEVQACYDNHDSIMIVPISTDFLRSMKIIGKSIDIDIIMNSKNTLFF